MITIGSLFSGIGGLELGLEVAFAEAGIFARTVYQIERETFPRLVLEKHWPEADRSIVDVCKAGAHNLQRADLICGGFPCQDISVAGGGAGLGGERSGLWREFARIVDECQPHIVIVENVAHGRVRYLCEVRSDLHELGYVTTVLLVSAFEVGAPHVRDRCFVVAHPDSGEVRKRAERKSTRRTGVLCTEGQAEPRHSRATSRRGAKPDVCRGVDGIPRRVDRCYPAAESSGLAVRWPARIGEQRREEEAALAIPVACQGYYQEDRLTALGNAVIPQAACEVGRWIAREGWI